jgi:hypothetical protein
LSSRVGRRRTRPSRRPIESIVYAPISACAHRPVLISGFPETDRCHNEFIDAMFGAIGRDPG